MLLTAGSPDQVDFVHDFLRLDVRGTDGHNHSFVRLTKKSASGEASATRLRNGPGNETMTDEELTSLLLDMESDRVERKESLSSPDRIRQAICAFANDLPNHQMPGVLYIGVKNDGACANLPITDELLIQLADMRDDGNILPLPTITVQVKSICGCEMAVVIVSPSHSPPVRYQGRVWVRVGPRRAIASIEDERRLSEKRRSGDLPYDLHPLPSASVDEMDLDLFKRSYLPAAISSDVLEDNQRNEEDQLLSLRFLSLQTPKCPTVVGMLVIGKSPADYVYGAFVQFLRIDGTALTDPITSRKELHGPAVELLQRLDDVLEANIRVATTIEGSSVEEKQPDYPLAALQQLVRNAVMHRDYQSSNAPTRITWFNDRIEIQNPGGPFGQVTRANFGCPGITDYRNPHVAEALRNLGFVQRFGVGIEIARKTLSENGNPELTFSVEDNHILATVRNRL